MHIVWIGLALLLDASIVYGGLTVAEKPSTELAGRILADTVGGKDCHQFNVDYYDASSNERTSVCNVGEYSENLKDKVAFVYDDTEDPNAVPPPTIYNYMCCLNKNICDNGDVFEMDGQDKRRLCGGGAPCGADHFCLADAANPGHAEYDHSTSPIKDKWSELQVCCRETQPETVCQSGNWLGDVTGVNECKKGRCTTITGTSGVCGPKKDHQDQIGCCEPSAKTCPLGSIPFGFKINDKVSAFDPEAVSTWGDNKDRDTWKKECEAMPNAYIHTNGLCCEQLELQANQTYDVSRIEPALRISTKTECTDDAACGADGFCAEAVAPSDRSKALTAGKMCFDKSQLDCPGLSPKTYPNLNAAGTSYHCESGCASSDVCIALPTAAYPAWPTGAHLCCPKAPYDATVCSKAVGLKVHPDVAADGKTTDLDYSTCKSAAGVVRARVELVANSTAKICCEWTVTGTANLDKDKAACKSLPGKGELSMDSKDPLVPMKCRDDGANDGDLCDGASKCRNLATGRKGCCAEDVCPASRIPVTDMVECSDPQCVYNQPNVSSQHKTTFCQTSNVTGKSKSYCCTPKPGCTAEGVCAFTIFPANMEPIKLAKRCTTSRDCGGYGHYCDGTSCNFVPGMGGAKQSTNICGAGPGYACPAQGGINFFCVLFEDPTKDGKCLSFTKVKEAEAYKTNKGLVAGTIGCAVVCIISAVLAVMMYLKYRSRNFCERKPKSKKKAKRDETTGGTTGGDTTTDGK